MRAVAAAFLASWIGATTAVAGSSGAVRTVHPGDSLPGVLREARAGDTVEVHGGTFSGPFVIDESIRLVGVDEPVLTGSGSGTVLRVAAPGVEIRGFRIRSTGTSLDEEHSGIAVSAPDAVIRDNRIEDALFGIYLRKAHRAVVSGNHVTGKDLALPRRGDAIRLWYSHDTRIEGNRVERTRDVVIWYSERVAVVGNVIRNGRYGLHFMYCDDATIEGNRIEESSVGSFLMYSRRLHLAGNRIRGNRGPSGYGIGLKDMDDAVLEGNLILDNRVGIYLDNSPREIDATTGVRGNVIAWNDVGVEMQPLLRRNVFAANAFVANGEQVGLTGGGQIEGNTWSVDGRGNYWSDYRGYDADGDGIGDVPYRSDRVFETIVDRHPELRLFRGPVEYALDFAARAFPVIAPRPKLEDAHPRMEPVVPEDVPAAEARRPMPLALVSATMLALALGLTLLPRAPVPSARSGKPDRTGSTRAMVEVRGVSRRFGKVVALRDVSFTLDGGDSVALWGRNGAGKTTALRCVLGLIRFDGTIRVAGRDVGREAVDARRWIGFVPQEHALHPDWTARETVELHAALRGVRTDARALLDRLGMADQELKPVAALSGGRKRLLALAVALVGDPPILLLDEPLSNLDPGARRRFQELLQELRAEGKTLVFTSHRTEEVVRLADRVIVLEDGAKVAEGPPSILTEEARPVGLRLEIAPEELPAAVGILAGDGFDVRQNGRGLVVPVTAQTKMRPIEVLLCRGVPVENFDVDEDHE